MNAPYNYDLLSAVISAEHRLEELGMSRQDIRECSSALEEGWLFICMDDPKYQKWCCLNPDYKWTLRSMLKSMKL